MRLESLKTKRSKDILDMIILAWLGDGPGGSVSTEYLAEILEKFPNSPWQDWAEWVLVQEETYQPNKKYLDLSPEERQRLLMSELHVAGERFIREHPNTHLMPMVLHAAANWMRWARQPRLAEVDEIASQLYARILGQYPTSEYYCASARRKLRKLLGEGYQETAGNSEERDKKITLFYCHSPEISKYQEYTKEYVAAKEQQAAETSTFEDSSREIAPSSEPAPGRASWRRPYYPWVALGVGVVVAGAIVAGVVIWRRKAATSRE
jgi:hypothetical protein